MIPANKHPHIRSLMDALAGADTASCVTDDMCIPPPLGCGGEATSFRDEVSEREYSISGLCQKCQDRVFGEDR